MFVTPRAEAFDFKVKSLRNQLASMEVASGDGALFAHELIDKAITCGKGVQPGCSSHEGQLLFLVIFFQAFPLLLQCNFLFSGGFGIRAFED